MRTRLYFILLLAIASASVGIADASIRSNQETVYIGGNPPDIIEEPTEYLLTTSDIQAQISNTQIRNGMKDGGFTCKPAKVDAGHYGYYNEPNYCEGKTIVQSISASNNHINAWIIGLHPSVSEYDAILQNIKDTRSIGSNYKATFENLPQLGERAFFMPTTISGGNGYEDTLVVQSGNVIVMISGSTTEEGKNSKEFLIDIARKYLSKISQVRDSQPNLIIQSTADKTVLEVGEYYNSGERFNIEFKSTESALITVKNSNEIIDSFVLEHSESRSYIADKASGNEMIEITGITAKGKTDSTEPQADIL